MSFSRKYKYWVDIAGMSISGFCALHCFLMPLLFLLLPLTKDLSHNMHTGLIFLIAPITLATIATEYLSQRSYLVLSLLTSGLCLVSLGAFAETAGLSAYSVEITTLLGSGLLITGHWLRKSVKTSAAVNKP